MKKIFFCLIVLLALGFINVISQDLNWQEKKGDHFIVYYLKGDSSFAKQVLRKAEKDYVRIARSFGYSRHSNFWTWDNRVRIYIYPDKDSYVKGTGMPQWSGGSAFYQEKIIASYSRSEQFLYSILPHEMGHLIFRDFVGFKGEVPLWLDEGVAQWSEKSRIEEIKQVMDVFVDEGNILSLKDLTQIDIRKVKKDDNVSYENALAVSSNKPLMALRGDELIRLFYYQAGSLVSFMAERYGIDKFSQFCRKLRDGESLDGALKAAYAPGIGNLDDLEQAWFEHIGIENN
ncbi:MAG: hypothetical protein JW867_01575 [Candidatus Omnitrophica bacterium]|nr:hypothetical protein [Candidatus Omnitrophota bacterium]